jgi:hypothetical protein
MAQINLDAMKRLREKAGLILEANNVSKGLRKKIVGSMGNVNAALRSSRRLAAKKGKVCGQAITVSPSVLYQYNELCKTFSLIQ